MNKDKLSALIKSSKPVIDVLKEAIEFKDLQNNRIYINKAFHEMAKRKKKEFVIDESAIFSDDIKIGTVSVYHDMSEFHRLKNELSKLNKKLRKVEEKCSFQDIIGRDQELLKVIKTARIAAATPATIMLRGESGTGKELYANAIHNGSKRRGEKFVKINCSSIPEELLESEIQLSVAGTKEAVTMVEAGAREVSEEVMLEAIMFGHEEIKRLIEFQQQIVNEIGQEKMAVELKVIDETIYNEVLSMALAQMKEAIAIKDKQARDEAISAVKEKVLEVFEERATAEDELDIVKEAKLSLDKIVKDEVRREITEDKVRPDGRALTEIRPLASRVDVLPRTHGSALFTRGQTQSLGVVTLGNLSDEQIIDDLTQEENKRFMLHYNFPAFSVGEVGFSRAPGRREIGHGALGERALAQVIPSKEDFPYTIRIVSEILESNGSSSQATICSGSMALMAAGVPIKAQVAGIAMGLVKKDEHYTILTDIQGMEDHLGDMDFKVAGTAEGITALQMDIKIDGLSEQILKESLEQARVGRLQILDHMNSIIAEPRQEVSTFAPKIKIIKIKPEKIKDVIGSGGKVINEIIEKTGVKIDIEQNGDVFISSPEIEGINKAIEIIENITREAEVGEIYLAEVKRIEKFGAFVELFPGVDALVHISKLAEERVNKVEDVVKVGDTLKVKVIKIDEKGRVDAAAHF